MQYTHSSLNILKKVVVFYKVDAMDLKIAKIAKVHVVVIT